MFFTDMLDLLDCSHCFRISNTTFSEAFCIIVTNIQQQIRLSMPQQCKGCNAIQQDWRQLPASEITLSVASNLLQFTLQIILPALLIFMSCKCVS